MAIIDEPDAGPVPEGYPTKDSPVVQAVARELMGDRNGDHWHGPVITNPATALHAAVRAVHAVLSLDKEPPPYLGFDDPRRAVAEEAARLTSEEPYGREPWKLLGDGEHRHYYDGQSLIHGHEGGETPHGYYEHDEDPRPEGVNVASPPARYQLSGVEGVDAVELGILLGSRSLVAVVDTALHRPVAWAHFFHAADVASALGAQSS